MAVFATVAAAIGFAATIIQYSLKIEKFAHAYRDAQRELRNTRQCLEVYHYTLLAWSRTWSMKAGMDVKETRLPTASSPEYAKLVRIWGEDGFHHVLKCVKQIEGEFKEVMVLMQSINVELSFPQIKSPPAKAASRGWRAIISSWFGIKPKSKRHSIKGQRHAQQVVPRNARGHKTAAPRTFTEKIRWGLSVKERLRQHRRLIKEWLETLRTVAEISVEEQREHGRMRRSQAPRTSNSQQQSRIPTDPPRMLEPKWTVDAAAEVLYSSLTRPRSLMPGNVQLTLLDPLDPTLRQADLVHDRRLMDRTGLSFKFTLLFLSDDLHRSQVAVAECFPPRLASHVQFQMRLDDAFELREDVTVEQIHRLLFGEFTPGYHSYRQGDRLLIRKSQGLIVLHPCNDLSRNSRLTQVSLMDILYRLPERSPRGSSSNFYSRLAMASTICSGLIELYRSGLFPLDFNSGSLMTLYPSSPHATPIQRCDTGAETLFVDVATQNKDISNPSRSIFDLVYWLCNQPVMTAGSRLSFTLHRLGIVLFEIGRGKSTDDVFGKWAHGNGYLVQEFKPHDHMVDKIHAEINRIQFGEPYRDVVRYCLTGTLYETIKEDVSAGFHELVMERLNRLVTTAMKGMERDISNVVAGRRI